MSITLLKKSQLTTQLTSDENEECREIRFTLPIINSTKNLHELKKIHCTQPKSTKNLDKLLHQQKINKLEREKAQLMESLEILKNGAVSAIVEKDEIIDKLRKLFNQANGGYAEEKDDSLMQKLQVLLERIRELQDDRNELKREAERKSILYEEQIQEREAIIQHLTSQLNWSIERIDTLEKYDKLLQEKIKVIEEDNQNLNVMLSQSQLSLKDEKIKYQEENQLLKNKSTSSIIHYNHGGGADSQNGSTSYLNKFLQQSQISNISLRSSLEQSMYEAKIQKLRTEHQLQIQDLTDFYESRIESLKKLCEQLPITLVSVSNSQKKCDMNMVYDYNDNRSNRSNLTNETQEKQRYREHQKMLRKNLSLGSIRSGNLTRMDPIDEREQIENPACTLKKEISMNTKRQQLIRVSSEASLGSKSSENNFENDSQFSYKYFEYPSSYRKNQNKISRVNSLISRTSKMGEKNKKEAKEKISKKFQKSQSGKKELKSELWEKLFWFTSGAITGGLFLTVGHRLFK